MTQAAWADNSRYQNVIEHIDEKFLITLESAHGGPELDSVKFKLAHGFKNLEGSGPKVCSAVLLSQKQSTALNNGQPRYKDTDFEYELKCPSGGNHFVSLVVRSFPDGKIDYGILSHPGGILFHDWMRYLFFMFLCAVPVFMFLVAYKCFRAKPKFRIAWLLFIFLGVGRLELNWTTGALKVFPFQMIFLGFQILEGSGGEKLLSLAFPLGAVFYLLYVSFFQVNTHQLPKRSKL